MKTVVIHSALLIAALGIAYQTWTRDEEAPDEPGSVRLWDGRPEEVASLTYRADDVRTVIERRRDEAGRYFWATVVHQGEAHAAAGATAAADTTAGEPASAPTNPGRRVSFLVGEQGERLAEIAASPLALRDLGVPDEERAREYGLDEPEGQLTIELDGETRTLEIGGEPWGSSDRYVRDTATGRAYVLDAPLLRMMSNAERSLPERRMHAFEEEVVGAVTVRTEDGERTMQRIASPDGTATWGAPATPDVADQTFANFMSRVSQLWIDEFAPEVEAGTLQRLVRLDYVDAEGERIGFLELYRDPKAGETPAYFARTELSRVVVRVHPSIAEQIDQDVRQLF